MPLTLLQDTLKVFANEHRAIGQFLYDGLADLPDRGDPVDWVRTPAGAAIGGDWHLDEVILEPGSLSRARLVARQPGFDWTWVGLRPISDRAFYHLLPASKVVDGELQLGYWQVFSNWDDEWNFTPATADPLEPQLKTWEIEFVSPTIYQHWLGRKNGAWPTGIVPPLAEVAGAYWCKRLAVEVEPWLTLLDGSATDYYRHTAIFWEAPVIAGTALEWYVTAWE